MRLDRRNSDLNNEHVYSLRSGKKYYLQYEVGEGSYSKAFCVYTLDRIMKQEPNPLFDKSN